MLVSGFAGSFGHWPSAAKEARSCLCLIGRSPVRNKLGQARCAERSRAGSLTVGVEGHRRRRIAGKPGHIGVRCKKDAMKEADLEAKHDK